MSNEVGLLTQSVCALSRPARATYKTLWTTIKATTAAWASGHTNKRHYGLDKTPKHNAPTLTYNVQRDYRCKTDQQVSFLTLESRLILPYTGDAST